MYLQWSFFNYNFPVDTIPPVIACLDEITETASLGSSGTTITWTKPTATDNFGVVSLVSRSYAPGQFSSLATQRSPINLLMDLQQCYLCVWSLKVGNVWMVTWGPAWGHLNINSLCMLVNQNGVKDLNFKRTGAMSFLQIRGPYLATSEHFSFWTSSSLTKRTSDHQHQIISIYFFSVLTYRKCPSWLTLSIWMHFSEHRLHFGFQNSHTNKGRNLLPELCHLGCILWHASGFLLYLSDHLKVNFERHALIWFCRWNWQVDPLSNHVSNWYIKCHMNSENQLK